MATKKTTSKSAAKTAVKKAATKKTENRTAAKARVRRNRRDAAKLEGNDSPEVLRTAQGVAAVQAVHDQLGSTATTMQSKIEQAMSEREAKAAEAGRKADEEVRAEQQAAAPDPTAVKRPPVLPSRFAGIHPDVTSTTSVPPGEAAKHTPGTGVADPDDLAPGQDLSPCPPGGVSILPQPDKPGSNFSKL